MTTRVLNTPPSAKAHWPRAGWAALLLLAPSVSSAQYAPGSSAPLAAGEEVRIADEALPQAAGAALAEGRRLEGLGLWGDAVAHYEQALRDYPQDRRLERRFDLARLHSSLERRYTDASFLTTARELDAASASEIYRELLAKIQSHYVVAPPWARIVEQGATAVLIAAADPAFGAKHGVRPSDQQLKALNTDIRRRLAPPTTVGSQNDAARLADEIARIAEYRIGAPRAAWTLELTAAAASSLDNYSAFLTPGQLKDVYSQIEGNFVGLGVELKADDGALLIVRVIPGSPAEKVGIVAGDRIIAVDGHATADLSTDEAAALLTGEQGSTVRVTVVTPMATRLVAKPLGGRVTDYSPPRVVPVRREHIEVPSLEVAKIIDPDYGVAYVRVPVFQKTTARDLEAALWDLHRQKMKSLIVDLRGNPGGLLTAAVELADKFVAQGNLVSTRGRSDGEDFDYRAHRGGTWRVPLVVLIDGDSASASEIFAAAIRDNRRGAIVGDRSFGKGSVQGIFPMSRSGAGVRLTTARFYSPKGHPISKVGVNPDIVVRHATGVAGGQAGAAHEVGFRGVERQATNVAGLAGQQAANRPAEPSDPALDRAVETARRQLALR